MAKGHELDAGCGQDLAGQRRKKDEEQLEHSREEAGVGVDHSEEEEERRSGKQWREGAQGPHRRKHHGEGVPHQGPPHQRR